jgi:prophage antirepressor-like protein
MNKNFQFEDYQLRAVTKDGEPWFIAKDVCVVLGITNYRDTLDKLDADERGVVLADTHGGQQKMAVCNESGLYTIVLRCDAAIRPGTLPYRFRRWVTKELLPTLRKEGAYSAAPAASEPDWSGMMAQAARDVLAGKLLAAEARMVLRLCLEGRGEVPRLATGVATTHNAERLEFQKLAVAQLAQMGHTQGYHRVTVGQLAGTARSLGLGGHYLTGQGENLDPAGRSSWGKALRRWLRGTVTVYDGVGYEWRAVVGGKRGASWLVGPVETAVEGHALCVR